MLLILLKNPTLKNFWLIQLRRSAKKSRMERTKNERIKEIMRVKGKPDIIQKRRLQ